MKYNGHKNWAYWNVALWIGNTESLYRLALECIRRTSTRDEAAAQFLAALGATAKTPDGAVYSMSSVKAALRGLKP